MNALVEMYARKNPEDCGTACPRRTKMEEGDLMMFSSCEKSVPASIPPSTTFMHEYR